MRKYRDIVTFSILPYTPKTQFPRPMWRMGVPEEISITSDNLQVDSDTHASSLIHDLDKDVDLIKHHTQGREVGGLIG